MEMLNYPVEIGEFVTLQSEYVLHFSWSDDIWIMMFHTEDWNVSEAMLLAD